MQADETSAPPGPAYALPRSGSAERVNFILTNEFGLLVLIVLFGAIFYLLTPGFMSSFNQFALGRTAAINILIGFAMMTVIVTGGLNLSVGAIGACAAMGCGWMIEVVGAPWPIAVLSGLALGAVLGLINGWAVVVTGLHSFIITLATMSIYFGGMIFLTRAGSYRELPAVFSDFGRMKILGVISPLFLVAIAVGIALIVLYRLTALGREMLAAGARPEAAELSGVRVGRIISLCHGLSGLVAAIAAILVVARTGAAIPSMAGQLGQDWLLPAFLGPVLGGTLLTGGKVSVIGTFLGALLVTMLINGLLLQQVGEFWIQTVLGLLLLFAVFVDRARRSFLASRRMV
jgi:ribose transport system permease protein